MVTGGRTKMGRTPRPSGHRPFRRHLRRRLRRLRRHPGYDAPSSLDIVPQGSGFWKRYWANTLDTFAPVAGYRHTGAFYLNYWRFVISQFTGAMLPLAIGLTLVPASFRLWATGITLGKLAVTCLVGCKVVSRRFPVLVSETGIKARNPAGLSCRLTWDQIVRVRCMWWCALSPQLRISAPWKSEAVWLPLFLTDMEGFTAAVCRHAPVDNPLRLFLEERYPQYRQPPGAPALNTVDAPGATSLSQTSTPRSLDGAENGPENGAT